MVKNLFKLLVILVIIGAVVFYFDLLNFEPRSRLLASFKAYQEKDVMKFQEYADLDSLAMSTIDELFILEKDLVGETIYDILTLLHGSPNGKPLIKKTVAKGLKEAMKISVKNNHVQEKHPKTFGFSDLISIQVQEKSGDVIHLVYPFKHQGKDLPVHFRMRKINGVWKLVGVTHFKEAIKVFNPFKGNKKEKSERRKKKDEDSL